MLVENRDMGDSNHHHHHLAAEIDKLKAAVRAKIKASSVHGAKAKPWVRAKCLKPAVKITKRKKTTTTTPGKITRGDLLRDPRSRMQHREDMPSYFLFEFALGYALLDAHGLNELDISDVHQHENYINRSDGFTLKAFHPFSSTSDALFQLNAISDSIVTPQLKNFLLDNIPKRLDGKTTCYLVTSDPFLGRNILVETGTLVTITCALFCCNIMRGLRMKIHKFIHALEPKDLLKQQLNLARLYSRQKCTTMVGKSSKSSSLQQLAVGQHRGRQMSSTMLNEDGTEVEYKIWNPLKSKLAAAILSGVKNIWAKPGSRVLYLGDVCEVTIAHLSNLVGVDGLVYVIGLSNDVLNVGEKWSNVITVLESRGIFLKYRMFVPMVDVIFADIYYPHEAHNIANHASCYLRAGGHYMISTRANNIDLTSKDKDLFANHPDRREFNPIEVVMLEPIVREYAMVIGSFRVLEE